MSVYRFDLQHPHGHLLLETETYKEAFEIAERDYPGLITASFINVGVSMRAVDAIWQPITDLHP